VVNRIRSGDIKSLAADTHRPPLSAPIGARLDTYLDGTNQIWN
jgi:hypothetical protein